jgi:hypothetical protein
MKWTRRIENMTVDRDMTRQCRLLVLGSQGWVEENVLQLWHSWKAEGVFLYLIIRPATHYQVDMTGIEPTSSCLPGERLLLHLVHLDLFLLLCYTGWRQGLPKWIIGPFIDDVFTLSAPSTRNVIPNASPIQVCSIVQQVT